MKVSLSVRELQLLAFALIALEAGCRRDGVLWAEYECGELLVRLRGNIARTHV